jgi:hypothetical protein
VFALCGDITAVAVVAAVAVVVAVAVPVAVVVAVANAGLSLESRQGLRRFSKFFSQAGSLNLDGVRVSYSGEWHNRVGFFWGALEGGVAGDLEPLPQKDKTPVDERLIIHFFNVVVHQVGSPCLSGM